MANPRLESGSSGQSIYETVGITKPDQDVGTRGFLDDGRVFYYVHNDSGAALTIAELQVFPEIVANHQELAVGTAAAAGQNVVSDITIGATALTANQYRNGYLVVTDNTGKGQMFKIREHAAADASATDVSITLYDNIVTALSATSTVSLHRNPYHGPQQGNTDQADIPVGVPVVTIADDECGWIQTWGPCPVLMDEAVAAVATELTIGTGTAGTVEASDLTQEIVVGYNIAIGVDTETQLVDLRIRP